MSVDDGIQMINEIYSQRRQDKAYQLYVAAYPNMTKESYMTFEEFYKPQKVNEEPVEVKSSEEILKDVKELMNSHSWR